MKCKYCGQEIDKGSIFCGYCGKQQPKVKYCVKCGQEIGLDDVFCGYCGASQNVEVTEASIEIGKQEEPNEVVQTSNNKSTDEELTTETEAVEVANNTQDVQEYSVPTTNSTEQIEKAVNEEKPVDETTVDDKNEDSKSAPFLDSIEDNNSNNSKKFVIALIAFLILLVVGGAYLFYFDKSDSNITNGEVIDKKTVALKGTINNKIGFTMHLSVSGNIIEGTEHYDSQREGINIIIRGSKDDNGTISLSEYDGSAKAGTFEGTVESGVFSGYFTNAKGKSFPFSADVSILSEEQVTTTETNENSTTFATKHVSFKQSSKGAETSIDIDYPIEGNANLVEAIRIFILETLVNTYTWGGEMPRYTGDMSNGQAVADFYGKTKIKMLKEENKRDYNSERQLEESISINIIKETERLVTYEVYFGGCHGGVYDGTTKGITFMKKDGKQLNLFKNENDEELKQMVIRYVKDYFGSDADCLNDSFYENPMPQEPPTLSFNGITFIYQRDEIAPRYMGFPSITIPFDEISKFLTEDAKEVSGINTSQTKGKK